MDHCLKILLCIVAIITSMVFNLAVLHADDSKNEKHNTQGRAAKHAAKDGSDENVRIVFHVDEIEDKYKHHKEEIDKIEIQEKKIEKALPE